MIQNLAKMPRRNDRIIARTADKELPETTPLGLRGRGHGNRANVFADSTSDDSSNTPLNDRDSNDKDSHAAAADECEPAPASENAPKNQPAEQVDRPLMWASSELLKGRREAWIEHAGQLYRLRLTSAGKLYLTK